MHLREAHLDGEIDGILKCAVVLTWMASALEAVDADRVAPDALSL